jgi:hypothetical protein
VSLYFTIPHFVRHSTSVRGAPLLLRTLKDSGRENWLFIAFVTATIAALVRAAGHRRVEQNGAQVDVALCSAGDSQGRPQPPE